MELIGIQKDSKCNLVLIKPKVRFFSFDLFPDSSHPEIILTKEEVKQRKLNHLIPKKLSLRDRLFNNGRRCMSYTVIDGVRVPITLKEKNKVILNE